MSSDPRVRVRGLGKCFHIYRRPVDRLRHLLGATGLGLYDEFWALRGVSFDVNPGETVGIVGRNGSGKSTLLQLICGTLTPTEGTVETNGRIAALLELGAGFNPEFTGRENVYVYGAILGFTREQIDARYDDIAAFADLGSFLEQPVKSYSSGMYMRLGFATAIHVAPEILIIDEALAVGDEAFQRKCLARITQIRDAGGTILFVSHSASAVVDLCDRAVLIDQGECLMVDTPKMTVSLYQRLLYAPPQRAAAVREEIKARPAGAEGHSLPAAASATEPAAEAGEALAFYDDTLKPPPATEYVSKGADILDVHLEDLAGRRVNVLAHGARYRYCYTVSFHQRLFRVRFGMLFKTVTGVELGGQVSDDESGGLEIVEPGDMLSIAFEFENRLLPGTYFGNAGVSAVGDEGHEYAHRLLDVVMFRVRPFTPEGSLPTGLVDLKPAAASPVTIARVRTEKVVSHA